MGLRKYAEVIADNDVDVDILDCLTEGHLEKLGISLGNRLRILKAIGTLTPGAFEAPAANPINLPSTDDATNRPLDAELMQQISVKLKRLH